MVSGTGASAARSLGNASKKAWDIFLDLQCPSSKRRYESLPALREAFGDSYEIRTHLTSVPYHANAFPAQSAAMVVGSVAGEAAKEAFTRACYAKQASYTHAARQRQAHSSSVATC